MSINIFKSPGVLTASDRSKRLANCTITKNLLSGSKTSNVVVKDNKIKQFKNYEMLINYLRGFHNKEELEGGMFNIMDYSVLLNFANVRGAIAINTMSDYDASDNTPYCPNFNPDISSTDTVEYVDVQQAIDTTAYTYVDLHGMTDEEVATNWWKSFNKSNIYVYDATSNTRLISGIIVPKGSVDYNADGNPILPFHDVSGIHSHFFLTNTQMQGYTHDHAFENHPSPFHYPNIDATNPYTFFDSMLKTRASLYGLRRNYKNNYMNFTWTRVKTNCHSCD